MDFKYFNLLFSLIIFLLVLSSAWLPFSKKKSTGSDHHHHHDFSFGETIATGIFLGAAMMHFLPESHALFQAHGINYPLSYLLAGLSFLFFLWLEHLGKELYHQQITKHAFILVAWGMLSAHSFFEGSALGLSNDVSMLVVLFLAIISHKWAEGFAIALQLSKSSLKQKNSYLLFAIYALMTPIGILLGYHFNSPHQSIYSPICMAISAGTFLYFGTLHGLERCVLVERCCNLKHFSFVILGFILMALVA